LEWLYQHRSYHIKKRKEIKRVGNEGWREHFVKKKKRKKTQIKRNPKHTIVNMVSITSFLKLAQAKKKYLRK